MATAALVTWADYWTVLAACVLIAAGHTLWQHRNDPPAPPDEGDDGPEFWH